MSRIQDILSKAERDGTARRTRGLSDEYPARSTVVEETREARPFVEPAPARPLHDDSARPVRTRRSEPQPSPAAATLSNARVNQLTPAAAPQAAAIEERPGVVADLDPHLVAAVAPTSLAAEQYRSLRTRIKRAENGRPLRTLAITSPNKGDGKSLTAANLALTMAQDFQDRVLLMDCDLRRPTVHQLFGVSEGPGVGDVLMSVAELDDALVNLPEHHLTILPAGLPPSHPAELLGSATMRRLLDTLRTRFDRILIDVPPVSPLADLHILAPMVDGLLMIVRAGVTPKPAIERALAGLDASKVLGLVLNESGDESGDAANYEDYGYIAG